MHINVDSIFKREHQTDGVVMEILDILKVITAKKMQTFTMFLIDKCCHKMKYLQAGPEYVCLALYKLDQTTFSLKAYFKLNYKLIWMKIFQLLVLGFICWRQK